VGVEELHVSDPTTEPVVPSMDGVVLHPSTALSTRAATHCSVCATDQTRFQRTSQMSAPTVAAVLATMTRPVRAVVRDPAAASTDGAETLVLTAKFVADVNPTSVSATKPGGLDMTMGLFNVYSPFILATLMQGYLSVV